MSIKSAQDYKYINYEQRKTVVVNQSLSTSTIFSFNFANHVRFQPKLMIIRQILYMPTALGNDIGTWLIWCSITSSNIGAFNVGVQANSQFLETIIPITTGLQSVDFNITSANTAINAVAPTGTVTITLEFVGEEQNRQTTSTKDFKGYYTHQQA
jgi:hypothetical protein